MSARGVLATEGVAIGGARQISHLDRVESESLYPPRGRRRLRASGAPLLGRQGFAGPLAARGEGVPALTSMLRARVHTVADRFDVGTLGRVADPAQLAMNDIGRVTLALHRPLSVDPYAGNRAAGGFVLIDESTNQTVGAGLVL